MKIKEKDFVDFYKKMTNKELAKMLGVSVPTIQREARKRGLTTKKRKLIITN